MVGLLGGALGWGDNPIYKGFDQRRMAIGQFGAGLMQGTSPQEGFAKGVQGALQGYQWDLDEQDRQRKLAEEQQQKTATMTYLQGKHPDLAAALEGGADIGQIWNEAWNREQQSQIQGRDLERARANAAFINDPQLKAMVEAGAMSFEDAYKYEQGGGMAQADISLQPQWGQDENGNWVMLQTSDTGQLIQSQVPPGVTLADPRMINTERAIGTNLGQQLGDAIAGAPGDISAGENALYIIESIRNDPELPYATGPAAALGANNPGVSQLVFGSGRLAFQEKVNQAKSGAFLTAIEQLRGMGALSNAEGQTATAAITRLNTAMSKEDFLEALADYEAIVKKGIANAQQRLQPGPVGPAAPSGGEYVTSTGVPWSF